MVGNRSESQWIAKPACDRDAFPKAARVRATLRPIPFRSEPFKFDICGPGLYNKPLGEMLA